MSKTAKRLKEMGVVLPKPAAPVANYVPSVRAGSLLFVSGQLPFGQDGKLAERHQGKLSANSEADAAREAAQLCVINVLAQAHASLGDLDRIKQVVRLGGFFNVEFELRRPAPGDERRVQFRRRTVRRSGPPRPNDGGRIASAPQCAGRGRSRVRDRGLTPVNVPSWLVERPIAHRGLHDSASGVIENTLRAAEAAIAGGFAIECDIQLSIDGEAIVFHDETLDRLTDATGPLSALSAAEIAKIGIKGSSEPPPTFTVFLNIVAGRTPIICELKSRFDGDWRIADRAAALAATYDGPLAFKSFDHDLVAYLRLRRPHMLPPRGPCPIGLLAQASYDDPEWAFLSAEQKRDWTDFDHYDLARPDFLSFNVDDLPHKIPFLVKELTGAPIMAWTVRTPEQREAAHKWADQIVFDGDPQSHRSWRPITYVGALGY